MLPVDFPEASITLTSTSGLTNVNEPYDDLRVHIKPVPNSAFPFIISKWQPNKEDIEAINAGGAIYLISRGFSMLKVEFTTENPL